MWFGYTHVERSRRGGCSTAAGDVLAEPTGKKHDERMIEGNSDSEKGSWLLSLEFSFSLNSFSFGLWFCSEYFVVPTTGQPSQGPYRTQLPRANDICTGPVPKAACQCCPVCRSLVWFWFGQFGNNGTVLGTMAHGALSGSVSGWRCVNVAGSLHRLYLPAESAGL